MVEAPEGALSRFTDDEVAALLELRRELHADPELSWQESRTADRLHRMLESLSPSRITRVARTGLVARFTGSGSSQGAVAVRGDIDALPIQEETGLPWASRNAGVMHACGHDVHATWALGAAMLLARSPAACDVLVVLQPAEEVGEGAKAILDSGALDDARAIFGAHVDRRFAVGEVVAESGALAASTDTFEIRLVGQGAHGARPHESADPIVGAAALVTALQTIVSRRIDPGSPAVVTVGTLHGGTAPNIIPATVTLTGTLRAMDVPTRQALSAELSRMARAIAEAHRLEAHVTIHGGTPPIVNPAGPSDWARSATRTVLGERALVPLGLTNMGGEDFAFYMERLPGAFLRIGAREAGGERIAAHSSRFVAADGSIFVGAAVLAESARVAAMTVDGRR